MRNKILLFSLIFLIAGMIHLSGQAQKMQLSAKKTQLQQLPPKLQVQQFSGDFAKWVTMVQVDVKQKMRFRWMPRLKHSGYAMILVRGGHPSGRVLRKLKLNNVPQPKTWGQFFLNPFQTGSKRPETLYVSVRLWKGSNQAASAPSPSVKIVYKKPSTTVTQFKLDTLRVVRVSPAGPITGPPMSSNVLNGTNALKITYYYDLVTENSAEIRQWLVLKKGSVAHHNFWFVKHITQKGRGQVTNLATIRCQTPSQNETHIYGVKYKLLYKGRTLAEGVKMFGQPIRFRCPNSPQAPKPDRLWIIDIKPADGASLLGPWDNNLTAGHALDITYGYELHSRDEAELRHWALKANGTVAANNLWYVGVIKRGAGQFKLGLAIKCMGSSQPDTVIKYIEAKLLDKNTKQLIKSTKKAVNYTFKCEKPGEIK
jgi:hypothetical protein